MMTKITDKKLLELPYYTKIRIIWNNTKYHSNFEIYEGIIINDYIIYTTGKIDNIITLAECVYNNICNVYIIE